MVSQSTSHEQLTIYHSIEFIVDRIVESFDEATPIKSQSSYISRFLDCSSPASVPESLHEGSYVESWDENVRKAVEREVWEETHLVVSTISARLSR